MPPKAFDGCVEGLVFVESAGAGQRQLRAGVMADHRVIQAVQLSYPTFCIDRYKIS
jgi:hypothetical protein